MQKTDSPVQPLPTGRILRTWWPLAAGWLLLTIEIPIYTAVIARLAEPKVNLAAWGVAFPLVLMLGAPAIAILATSTALSKDWRNYQAVRRYMWWMVALMTALHFLLAFTPLYDWLVTQVMAVPAEVVEPARLGIRLMLPYVAALAYRRFNYGVLIRFGHSSAMMIGVITRLVTDIVLLGGFVLLKPGIPGVAVATGTMAIATAAEAIYAGLRVQPVLRGQLKGAPAAAEAVTSHNFLAFYIPLVLTTLLQIVAQPILNAALSRMPDTLESLAVFPVIYGLVSFWTSVSMAYVEVAVVLLDEPRSAAGLRRFALLLGGVTTGALLVVAASPLSSLWFVYFSALPPSLLALAHRGLWFVLPIPMFRALQSWYQGVLMNSKQTRGITEAIILFILTNMMALWGGAVWGQVTGLFIGLLAFTGASLARTLWLGYRTRPVLRARNAREGKKPALSQAPVSS